MIEKLVQEDFGYWKCNFTFERHGETKSVTKTSVLSTLADKGLQVQGRKVEFKPNIQFIEMKPEPEKKQPNMISEEVKDMWGMKNDEEESPKGYEYVTQETVTVIPFGNGMMRKTMRVVSKRMKKKTKSQRHEDYAGDNVLNEDVLDFGEKDSNEFDEEVDGEVLYPPYNFYDKQNATGKTIKQEAGNSLKGKASDSGDYIEHAQIYSKKKLSNGINSSKKYKKTSKKFGDHHPRNASRGMSKQPLSKTSKSIRSLRGSQKLNPSRIKKTKGMYQNKTMHGKDVVKRKPLKTEPKDNNEHHNVISSYEGTIYFP